MPERQPSLRRNDEPLHGVIEYYGEAKALNNYHIFEGNQDFRIIDQFVLYSLDVDVDVDVEVEAELVKKNNSKFRKGFSCTATRMEYDDCIPQRHSSYDY
ncbi:hypothetical protein RND71_014650 [Anisodus tanguticus]|uniref:Uncharacterized protein n=1 Tax=Anisodus tanguticus TaxID=243964 RepID=A0AAE1SBL8_9SOLA|nr:hypothetical protein RND71_014650 [Anisodus tanguticus]